MISNNNSIIIFCPPPPPSSSFVDENKKRINWNIIRSLENKLEQRRIRKRGGIPMWIVRRAFLTLYMRYFFLALSSLVRQAATSTPSSIFYMVRRTPKASSSNGWRCPPKNKLSPPFDGRDGHMSVNSYLWILLFFWYFWQVCETVDEWRMF